MHGGSCFFNGFEACCRCADWSSTGRVTRGLRRTFVLLERSDVHLKLLFVYVWKISHHRGSVQNSLYAICLLELAAMNHLNDQVWVGSSLYAVLAQVGTYGKTLVVLNLA